MTILKTENFKESIKEGLVLVDFFATWCGPCKMMVPILEELAGKYEGKVKIFKVDIDESSDLADIYNIQAVPTMILFKDGKMLGNIMGYHPVEELEQVIKKYM